MAPLLLPPSLTGASTLPKPGQTSAVELEALIKEARRRARRRRLTIASAVAVVAVGTALLLSVADPFAGQTNAKGNDASVATGSLKLDLAGFGTPLPTQVDSGPCPNGRTRIGISIAGVRAGVLNECVLTIAKLDVPNWGVKKIAATTRDTYALRGGTIVTRERHLIHFARDQVHSSASFRGKIIGGSGRYAHARGSMTGGGSGANGHADWKLTFHLKR